MLHYFREHNRRAYDQSGQQDNCSNNIHRQPAPLVQAQHIFCFSLLLRLWQVCYRYQRPCRQYE
jgi:hypothetical protein